MFSFSGKSQAATDKTFTKIFSLKINHNCFTLRHFSCINSSCPCQEIIFGSKNKDENEKVIMLGYHVNNYVATLIHFQMQCYSVSVCVCLSIRLYGYLSVMLRDRRILFPYVSISILRNFYFSGISKILFYFMFFFLQKSLNV